MTGLIRVLLISLMSALIVQGDVENIRNLVREKGLDPKLVVDLEGRIYFIGGVTENYDDAVTLCNDISMVLVSLETEHEERLLGNYIRENVLERFFATSGTKLYDRWFWSGSGQEFTYTNWAPGEPLFPGNPVCAYLLVLNVDFPEWHSESCNATNNVICEQNTNYCP